MNPFQPQRKTRIVIVFQPYPVAETINIYNKNVNLSRIK
ncbi:hypothetical protein D3OALGB2SA_3310 [Olavius algarvensis associated proteobacterium Delta 3]|nr:hypothetical protein D3OALGB2SA_3310 [Olavius algarvensis associated proteobacterium Delta 3]